jgi:hypothetical protein
LKLEGGVKTIKRKKREEISVLCIVLLQELIENQRNKLK